MLITCQLGRLRENLALPDRLDLLGRPLDDYFRQSSRVGRTAPAIDLRFDTNRQDSSLLKSGEPTTTQNLSAQLELLTGVDHRETGPVSTIGVIFADFHELNVHGHDDRPIFGAMFDVGFAPTHPGIVDSERFWGQPRNGCAVFLNAIANHRQGEAFDREVLFTTIHELGHVFNLWHLPGTKSFMSSADNFGSNGPPPEEKEYFRFLNGPFPAHQTPFLSRCGDSDFVTPGGSPYGWRDTEGPPGDRAELPHSRARSTSTSKTVRLEIDPSKRDFWHFEPVELDIKVSAKNKGSVVKIPDAVDPAYESFAIFIDQPDGTRVRYRPTRYLCPHGHMLRIKHGRPFRRDITIFGQSGGYTFNMPGVHTIQAQLRVSKTQTAFSNTVRIVVRPPSRKSGQFRKLEHILTSQDCAMNLFYRTAPRDARKRRRLVEAYRNLGRTYAGAYMKYSLAQSLAKLAHVAQRRARPGLVSQARELLKACAQSHHLGEIRRRKSLEIDVAI